MSAKLCEILDRENLSSPQHLREALDYQREHGGRLGFNLVKLGLVRDDMIPAVLSRQYGIPSVNLELFQIDAQVLHLIPQEVAQKYSVLPLSRVGASLTLAMVDPTNVFAMDDVKFMTGLNVEPVVVAEASIQQAIAKYYGTSREIELSSVAADELALESAKASNGNGRITHADLVSLDSIDFETGEAADGEVLEDNEEMDFRVSTLPTLFGEKVVLRLLDKENLMLDMTKLGFEPESLAKFQRNISKPYGMVLVTGPTGSGKTNTPYSALQSLNTVETNIMTAEDPVEFNLMGINQVQMKEQIGLNFAAALRAFLRQDPNIVLVGEIRDFETAEIAIKAALTGHLVLSTLHTNDAPSTISRLMNMGIEPFLVATSVNLICAQRLVRKICVDCKREHPTPPEAMVEVGFTAEEVKTLKKNNGKVYSTCN